MHQDIFTDSDIGLSLSPVYAAKELTLEISLQSTSETELENWLSDFVRRTAQFRLQLPHELSYSFTIANGFFEVAKAIHRNRKDLYPDAEDFSEYLNDHLSLRATVLTGLAGKNMSLVVSETQVGVMGGFDFDVIPDKPEIQEEIWQISFTYKLPYQKAIGFRIQYPIMPYNQLLPNKFVTFGNTGYDPINSPFHESPSMYGLSKFNVTRPENMKRTRNFVARIPYFDDKVLTNIPANTASVLTALCSVDTDKRFVLNLHELGDFEFDSDIMAFIQDTEWEFMNKRNQSFFQIHLYHNDYTVPMEKTYLSKNLNFGSTEDLNLSEEHRVRISLVTNFASLPRSAFERLRKYPKALVKIVGTLNDMVINHPDYNKVVKLEHLTPEDMEDVIRLVKGTYGSGVEISLGSESLFSNIPNALIDNYHKRRKTLMTAQTSFLTASHIFKLK